jgi:hypothetical protein
MNGAGNANSRVTRPDKPRQLDREGQENETQTKGIALVTALQDGSLDFINQ